jgi:hypothetical protein
MMPMNTQLLRSVMIVSLIAAPLGLVYGQASSNRGLWVGQVNLTRVNEVSIPLNAQNVPIAPDPLVATPTGDAAQLRVILHVNGAGQASLLKDVAILRRVSDSSTLVHSDNEVALVTDESLYGSFPPQPAKRLGTAVFDFGDSRATDAVNAIMDAAALAAAATVNASSANFATLAGRNSAKATAFNAAKLAADPIVPKADAATAFAQFLNSYLNSAMVDAVASSANPTNAVAAARVAATNLLNASFYKDSRGIQVVDALLGAVAAGTSPLERAAFAQNRVASFADVANDTQRFIAGELFGKMIMSASATAAAAATNSGANLASIQAGVSLDAVVNEAKTASLQLKVPQYSDTRGNNAIDQVLDAIIEAALASGTNVGASAADVQAVAEQAGRNTLDSSVARYSVSSYVPTTDYTAFIHSAAFLGCAEVAATAAADGAVSERANSSLYTLTSLQGAARAAAVTALQAAYSAAARAVRTELPMQGQFGPGLGDPRLTWDIKQINGVALGAGALTATLYLPANHPTNPFRHRRHPDHTAGFDVRRNIRIDFDGSPTNSLDHAGFGVDRITGTYREEITGLHKPLGPQQSIGLKVEGPVEFSRISLIDTLNAR